MTQADGDNVVECEDCGDDFTGRRVRNQRARGWAVCVGCASDAGKELDREDLIALEEEYWTSRERD